MATHSSILAWRIPWTEESLVGYSWWGHKESDMTEHGTKKEINYIIARSAFSQQLLAGMFVTLRLGRPHKVFNFWCLQSLRNAG